MATGISTTPTSTSPLVDFSPQALKKVWRFSLVIAIGSFLFGYDTGVVSGALLFIKSDFGLTAVQQGTVVSVLLLGAIAGAQLTGRIRPTQVDPEVAKLQQPHQGRAFALSVESIEPKRRIGFRWHP